MGCKRDSITIRHTINYLKKKPNLALEGLRAQVTELWSGNDL